MAVSVDLGRIYRTKYYGGAGVKVDFRAIKEKGYAALGWDAKTGKPLESTLQELGLKELVGRLP